MKKTTHVEISLKLIIIDKVSEFKKLVHNAAHNLYVNTYCCLQQLDVDVIRCHWLKFDSIATVTMTPFTV